MLFSPIGLYPYGKFSSLHWYLYGTTGLQFPFLTYLGSWVQQSDKFPEILQLRFLKQQFF